MHKMEAWIVYKNVRFLQIRSKIYQGDDDKGDLYETPLSIV